MFQTTNQINYSGFTWIYTLKMVDLSVVFSVCLPEGIYHAIPHGTPTWRGIATQRFI
jgi:hypothetical protein